MTQKSVCWAGKIKKNSHSIARYRSKVKRQIILHLENTDVVTLCCPYGAEAYVTTQSALAEGQENITEKSLTQTD